MNSQNTFIRKAKLVDHLKSPKKTTLSVCISELNISRRTFFRYLDDLRDVGAKISYSKVNGCYNIENEFDFIKAVLGNDSQI